MIDRDSALPRLSVVAPCFNEAESLSAFLVRMTASAETATGGDFEIILVDDGSTDGTSPLMAAAAAHDPRVIAIRLRRNFGHQMAVLAGLRAARGARVLLIDADLQDPPELIGPMMCQMNGGADVVYGRRVERVGETVFKRGSAALFYRLLRQLSSVDIPVDAGDFRLMTRRVVDLLLALPEQHRFTRGLVSWLGGRQEPIDYVREARFAGETKYPLAKMLRFALDALTSFSIKPLRLATWLGFAAAGLALMLMGYSAVQWARGHVVDGWTSLFIAVTTFSAVQLVVLGIIGEYLGRLVIESKHRPHYIVDTVISARALGGPAPMVSPAGAATVLPGLAVPASPPRA